MKARDLTNIGIPSGATMKVAMQALGKAAQEKLTKDEMVQALTAVQRAPTEFIADHLWGELAAALIAHRDTPVYIPREVAAPYQQWGDDLEAGAIQQMQNACQLPVAIRGALMPDAHQGYGLPIGGVLATQDAIIPYAVGMDIACRMKLTVLDLPCVILNEDLDRLKSALSRETSFGVGARFKHKREHAVMDEDWEVSEITSAAKDKAWAQLGSSGSGNHFVEFGIFTLTQDDLGLTAGKYLALLSHSGSRGVGAKVATHYSKLAMDLHSELDATLKHLAWLTMSSTEGQEYWAAMELMGKYAAANHALIHQHIAGNLGVETLLTIENHHNFAWRETHDGQEVIVHRKGATPAHVGVLGVIPGSMGTPGYIVRGKGTDCALRSASHGAGRRMSRKQAFKTFNWEEVKRYLKKQQVVLMGAGLDEAPMAYKDIEQVMAAQTDLVERIARFDPRLVRMAKGR